MHLSKHRLQVKTVQKSCHMWVNFDVRGQQGMDFITGGSVIMDYGLVFWPEVTKKLIDLFIKNTDFSFTRC